jgi:hypothetical protein
LWSLLLFTMYINNNWVCNQCNFGTGVQLKLRKHPNAYIANSNTTYSSISLCQIQLTRNLSKNKKQKTNFAHVKNTYKWCSILCKWQTIVCIHICQAYLKKERADAKNAVEEYVYDMRDKLCEQYEPFIRETVSPLVWTYFIYK